MTAIDYLSGNPHRRDDAIGGCPLEAWQDAIDAGEAAGAPLLRSLLALTRRTDLDPDARALLQAAVAQWCQHDHALLGLASRYRDLFEAIPDGIVLLDADGRIVDANRASGCLFGCSREELRAAQLHELCPGVPADLFTQVAAHGEADRAVSIETTVRRRDGREFPVEIHAGASRGVDPARVVVAVRGIGHWRRTAAHLREMEARYNALAQMSGIGIVVRSAGGRVLWTNDVLRRTAPAIAEAVWDKELAVLGDARFVDEHGTPVDATCIPFARALATGLPVEGMVLGLEGALAAQTLWFNVSAIPLFRANEETPHEIVCTYTDITTLKRVRDLLARTQAAGGVGGFEVHADWQRLVLTDEMYRLLDLPAGVPVGWGRMIDHVAAHCRARALLDFEEVAKGGSMYREYEVVTALGRQRWISVAARPLWRNGKVHTISGICQDVTERKQLEQELRVKAATDVTTGLYGRDGILDELQAQILAGRGNSGPTLLHVDLDRFKVVNDVLGMRVGDRLLAMAGERLRESLPPGAQCGRFAGDEFLVVLPPSARNGAANEIAEKICAGFRRPFAHDGRESVVTASIGIARHPQDGRDAGELLRHADAALAEAKLLGGGAWHAFSPTMGRRIEHRVELRSRLADALANDELRLAWQPQIDLADDRVVAVEALLRWQHPAHGELLPLAFLPTAEASGDIVAIGAWAIGEACRQLREWRDAGVAVARVAVNVSFHQILDDAFVGAVARALDRHDLAGSSLELELAEHALVHQTPETVEVLKKLRALGVGICIDNFGYGPAALGLLRQLPIDGFKLGCELMRRIPADGPDTAVCEALVHVGRSLGLRMAATGVETAEQKNFLQHVGMESGQGHLLCPELTAPQFADFVLARQSTSAPSRHESG